MDIPYQFQISGTEEEQYAARKAELSKACSGDPQLTKARLQWFISNMTQRAEVTEDCAKQLLTTLMSAATDKHLLHHLSLIKEFPEYYEGEQIIDSCSYIEEKITRLENMKDQIRRISSEKYYESMDKEEELKELKKGKKSSKIQDPYESPINKMYRNMTQSEMILSLASEVNQLKREFVAMHEQHKLVQDAFAAVKGEKTWILLCKCIEDVDHMKRMLNAMTDGQFETGIIEYVDPRRVNKLERRLMRTDNNLQIMESALERLQNFKTETEVMLAKCNPILEQLYITEQKQDTLAEDLKNANEISDRIGVLEVDVEAMSNVINALLERLAGRIAVIEANAKKMKLLNEGKASKDYVQSTFPLMADKALVDKTVSYKDMANVFNELGEKLMNCFGRIMKTMVEWDEKLELFQLDATCKINKGEFSQLVEILEKKSMSLYMKVRGLEIGHTEEQNLRTADEKMVYKDLQCITCDMDAVMNCNPDVLVPILPACPARYRIAPQVAYELSLMRDRTEELPDNATMLSQEKCPADVSCVIKENKATHCEEFGKKSCKDINICPSPNNAETLINISEINNLTSQVTQPNTKISSAKRIEEVDQTFSQSDKSTEKNAKKVKSKSSKKITKKKH